MDKTLCGSFLYGSKPFEETIMGLDENSLLIATRDQLDDILHQIRAHTRGLWLLYY